MVRPDGAVIGAERARRGLRPQLPRQGTVGVVRRDAARIRNSVGPAVTMIGLDFGIFLGGVLIVEQVFGWPGIGQQAWNAISANDIPVVLGHRHRRRDRGRDLQPCADIANALLDPRIKYA